MALLFGGFKNNLSFGQISQRVLEGFTLGLQGVRSSFLLLMIFLQHFLLVVKRVLVLLQFFYAGF